MALSTRGIFCVQNVDSTVDIKLDEEILSKGEQKGLKPGNVIYFGNTSAFQVMILFRPKYPSLIKLPMTVCTVWISWNVAC